MKLEDVKKYLSENKQSKEVQEYIKSLQEDVSVDVETIKELIEKDEDIKSFIDSIKDKHSSKALETWKSNNLDEIVNLKVKELYPEKDEKDIVLQELQLKVEAMEREKTHERLKNVALKTAADKGLPINLVDYFIGEDEEKTVKNLSNFEEVFNSKLEETVKSKLKDGSYTPPKGESKSSNYTIDELELKSPEEINKIFEEKLNKK